MFSNDILDRTPKTQSIELITDKLDFINKFCSTKDYFKSTELQGAVKSFKDSTKMVDMCHCTFVKTHRIYTMSDPNGLCGNNYVLFVIHQL